MHEYIEERVVEVANYIIENGATVRQAAGRYGISKSTVHKDVAERLAYLDPAMAAEVRRVLQRNKDERHIRGGHATYLKYKSAGEAAGRRRMSAGKK